MKTSLTIMAVVAASGMYLSSCTTTKDTLSTPKFENSVNSTAKASCFVQMNDGTIKKFNEINMVTGVLVTPYLLADGKIKIDPKDIKAYQNHDHYAISQKQFKSGRISYAASEVLPGFAEMIASGKLIVYKKTIFNGERAIHQFFVQEGKSAEILPYNNTLIQTIIKDNTEALNYFNSNTDKNNLERKLQTTAYLFNNDLATANKK